jgi:uncharacterized protein YigA (DUF484 family)
MSASKKRGAAAKATGEASTAGLDDDIVREYLKNHDDFLQRNPDMFDYLHIAHASGSAISLVEKQVSVLRERNKDMRQRLKLLTANARDNDALFELTRTLVLKLLDANSVAELYGTFMDAMTSDFRADYATMILYENDSGEHGGHRGDAEGWRTETRETVKREIGSLFRGHKAVCGALRSEELAFLFPSGSGAGSAALMPLSLSNGGHLGLLAVGSADANYYNSKVGTMFLSHVADVLVKLLARLQHSSS